MPRGSMHMIAMSSSTQFPSDGSRFMASSNGPTTQQVNGRASRRDSPIGSLDGFLVLRALLSLGILSAFDFLCILHTIMKEIHV